METHIFLILYKVTSTTRYYKKIARVILVNLNWFYEENDFGLPDKQEFILPYPNYKKTGYILKIININLDRYNKLCYNQIRDEDKFYKLLTLKTKEDLDSLTSEEFLLKSYSNKIINLSKNDEYREKVMNERIEANLLRQEGYFEGIEEGIEKGIQEGIQEKQKEVVLNMVKDKISPETISKYTNLTKEEVEQIINNNQE